MRAFVVLKKDYPLDIFFEMCYNDNRKGEDAMNKIETKSYGRTFTLYDITGSVVYTDREDKVAIPVSVLKEGIANGASVFVSDDNFYLTDDDGQQYVMAESLFKNAGTFNDADEMVAFLQHMGKNIYLIDDLLSMASGDRVEINYV